MNKNKIKNKNKNILQTDMMTKAELAFTALDRDNKGYISEKDFKKLTKKLSDQELKDLMTKVNMIFISSLQYCT